MADDAPSAGDLSDAVGGGCDSPKEDAATKATREELKQTAISDPADKPAAKPAPAAGDKKKEPARDEARRTTTPELGTLDTGHEALRDQVSSPKKKRAHDELEVPNKDGTADDAAADEDMSTGSGSGSGTAASRTDRAEPEKKRPRDKQVDDALKSTRNAEARFSPTPSDFGSPPSPVSQQKQPAATEGGDGKDTKPAAGASSPSAKAARPAISVSGFASSGFAKLTGTNSPFGALAASPSKGSLFASSSTSGSSFGALGGAKPAAPTLSFGSKTNPASPFASLNGQSAFGSTFKTAFGGSLGGAKLTSFGKPGEVLKSDKPARPFGAPESDATGDSDSGSDDDEHESGDDDPADGGKEKEPKGSEHGSKAAADDKKKARPQKAVNDGEAGEATLLQVRAKIYHLDKVDDDAAWKERGAGMLKVNVPARCVDLDSSGNPVANSFDAEQLQDDDDDEESGDRPKSKVVRLVMRQDSTLRVILNTAVLPTMQFQKRQTLKAMTVGFTAFEAANPRPVPIQLKMSAANCTSFLTLIAFIQKELRGD